MARALADVVTAAAAELMAATAGNSAAISERVLADLVSHLGVDFGFLRHNDHAIHATVLIAEWPVPENVPDRDPIGVVYFADADSVFAMTENLKEPDVVRPEPANDDGRKFTSPDKHAEIIISGIFANVDTDDELASRLNNSLSQRRNRSGGVTDYSEVIHMPD